VTTLLGVGSSADVKAAATAIVALVVAAQQKESAAQLFGLVASDLPVILALIKDIEAAQPAV
jgi:hypothetical protein